jgi:hypothetical protein
MDLGSIAGLLTGGPEGVATFVAMTLFKWFSGFFLFSFTAWMRFSSADIFLGDPSSSASVVGAGLQATRFLVYVCAAGSLIYSIIKIILTGRAEPLGEAAFMIARVVISTGAAISLSYMCLQGSDVAGPWLAGKISGLGPEQLLKNPFPGDGSIQQSPAAFMLAITMVLNLPLVAVAGYINFLFVIGTYVIVIIVNITMPILAGSSASPSGKRRFDMAVGWLTAACVYKIGAGIVTGVAMGLFTLNMFGGTGGAAAAAAIGGVQVGYLLTGNLALLMSIFILPVLIRLAIPGMRAVSGVGVGKVLGMVAMTVGVAAGAIATGGLSAVGAGAGMAGSGAGATTGAGAASVASESTAGATSGGGLGTATRTGSEGSGPSGNGGDGAATAGHESSTTTSARNTRAGGTEGSKDTGSPGPMGSVLGATGNLGYGVHGLAGDHERLAEEALGEGEKV